jgi:hypothetical protein
MEVSSPFEKAALLTEAMLIANLAIRGFTTSVDAPPSPNARAGSPMRKVYPSRGKKLLWDAKNMRVTNVDIDNQYVKGEYRDPWKLSGI